MSQQSLEALLQKTSPVKLLRNSQIGAHVYPVVQSEYTNWRDEQRAWQKTCVLFNQSYHMTDMYVEGPDALKLLSDLGINTFKNFGPNKAKQFIACNHEGYVIGDVILFGLEPNVFNLVGRPSVHNWVQYNCETGGYNVKCTRDERAAAQKGPVVRKTYRYQVQGPNAMKVMEKVLGGSGAGRQVLPHGDLHDRRENGSRAASRHGRPARLRTVRSRGRRRSREGRDRRSGPGVRTAAGRRPGVFLEHAGIRLDPFASARHLHQPEDEGVSANGCPPTSYEAIGSLGGSFYSENIEDYYLTPYDLGYGPTVKFDHDFVGREALEKIAKNPKRTKVTLALNDGGCDEGHGHHVRKGRSSQVLRVPVGRVFHVAVRQGHEERQDHRHLHLGRLQLQ